jgi:hypothetical protein
VRDPLFRRNPDDVVNHILLTATLAVAEPTNRANKGVVFPAGDAATARRG